MKCSACKAGKCEGDYKYNYLCDGKGCTCKCQIHPILDVVTKVGSGIAGAATMTAGFALTGATGGLFANVGGFTLIGAGAGMITNPIEKEFNGEHMNAEDWAKDVFSGAAVGFVTSPLSYAALGLTSGASGAMKLGVRVAFGAGVGGLGAGFREGVLSPLFGGDTSAEAIAKAIVFGAIGGGLGGGVTHAANNFAHFVADMDIVKALARLAATGVLGFGADALVQKLEKGEVDVEKLLLGTEKRLAKEGVKERHKYYQNQNRT